MQNATRCALMLFATLTLLVATGCDSGGSEAPPPEPEPVPNPTAAFSADSTTITVGAEVSFTNESADADTWAWDFGDGQTSEAESPAHTYAEAGSYTVTLTASSDEGSDTEEKTDYITVEEPPMPPEAAFSVNETTVGIADTLAFTDESENAENWSWDFGDGTTSEEQNSTHAFQEDGTYQVELTVTNEDGEDSATELITVEPRRTYSVEYRADATFAECDVSYDNESGGTTRRTINFADRDEPWTLFVEMTVEEFSTAFAGLSVSCSDFDQERTASAELIIDGGVFASGEETGTSVSLRFDSFLTLEGAEEI